MSRNEVESKPKFKNPIMTFRGLRNLCPLFFGAGGSWSCSAGHCYLPLPIHSSRCKVQSHSSSTEGIDSHCFFTRRCKEIPECAYIFLITQHLEVFDSLPKAGIVPAKGTPPGPLTAYSPKSIVLKRQRYD